MIYFKYAWNWLTDRPEQEPVVDEVALQLYLGEWVELVDGKDAE